MHHCLTQVIGLMEAHPIERLSVLAREAHVSVRWIQSLFRADMGTTFAAFRREQRMRGARSLLTNPRKSVKEIAFALGYGAVEVFCREFKRVNGCTPTDFRSRFSSERHRTSQWVNRK